MSTIRNANPAAVAAQYTQEYRTPYRPGIAFLSTRLRMKRLSRRRPWRATAVRSGGGHPRPQGTNPPASTAKSPTPSAHSTPGGAPAAPRLGGVVRQRDVGAAPSASEQQRHRVPSERQN